MKQGRLIAILIATMAIYSSGFSQPKKKVNWLSFEQLEDSLAINPKNVFIEFYADWCAPCLRMQREVFTDSEVINTLNNKYYAVKMNIETADTISFGGDVFINERVTRRNPIHQIPLLMASRKNKPFSLPAMVFLDKNFQAQARYFQYLDAQQFLKILNRFTE